jgi:hypothetical protein
VIAQKSGGGYLGVRAILRILKVSASYRH